MSDELAYLLPPVHVGIKSDHSKTASPGAAHFDVMTSILLASFIASVLVGYLRNRRASVSHSTCNGPSRNSLNSYGIDTCSIAASGAQIDAVLQRPAAEAKRAPTGPPGEHGEYL
jgi:hypothetical protein